MMCISFKKKKKKKSTFSSNGKIMRQEGSVRAREGAFAEASGSILPK